MHELEDCDQLVSAVSLGSFSAGVQARAAGSGGPGSHFRIMFAGHSTSDVSGECYRKMQVKNGQPTADDIGKTPAVTIAARCKNKL